MPYCLTHHVKLDTRELAAQHANPECVTYAEGVEPNQIDAMDVQFSSWPNVEEINLDNGRDSFMPVAPLKNDKKPDKVEEGHEIA
jgi:hypothetical protein